MNDTVALRMIGVAKRFRVRGTIEAQWECDCEFCEGHIIREHVDRTLIEVDAEAASARILGEFIRTNKHGAWDADWLTDPIVEGEELPEDERMRLLGAPMLFFAQVV